MTELRAGGLAVHVSGPLACFTRPEVRDRACPYPVITPPAAVGLLSAIFWKPEVRWSIREIWVLNPVAWYSMTRNEVSDRASPSNDGIDPVASSRATSLVGATRCRLCRARRHRTAGTCQ